MKKITQLAAAIALVSGASAVQADLSANIGFASEYYYRGVLQKESSASAGIDYEQGGFYAGAWSADVGDGLEVDGYFGYGLELGEVTVSGGFTGYYYTGEFDETYEELNLNIGWGIASLELTSGEWEDEDYTFAALTLEHEGFYATYGTFGNDFDGDYLEVGYGTTISEIDFGVAAIFNSDELSDQGDGDSGEALVFTISKSFDL